MITKTIPVHGKPLQWIIAPPGESTGNVLKWENHWAACVLPLDEKHPDWPTVIGGSYFEMLNEINNPIVEMYLKTRGLI